MKKFVVKFENCYGIKKMEYPFDFSKLFEDIDSNANQVNVDITEATEYIDNTTDADFIKKLRNRVSLVSLVDENYLRFDHPNWDFYEKYSSTFKNFNMNVKKHPMLKVSAKGEKYYTDFDLAITFYGTVNLKNFKYLILEVNNKDNFIPNKWDSNPVNYKLAKIIFNNTPLYAEDKSKISNNPEFCKPLYNQGKVEYVYKLPKIDLIYKKICIVIAPGTI